MPEEAKSRPGVLSSVFGFVARELGSFVTTATGGEVCCIPKECNSVTLC